MMRVLYGGTWVLIGAYVVAMALGYRPYLKGLPPTAGNQQLQRRNVTFFVFGIGMVFVGLWQFLRALAL